MFLKLFSKTVNIELFLLSQSVLLAYLLCLPIFSWTLLVYLSTAGFVSIFQTVLLVGSVIFTLLPVLLGFGISYHAIRYKRLHVGALYTWLVLHGVWLVYFSDIWMMLVPAILVSVLVGISTIYSLYPKTYGVVLKPSKGILARCLVAFAGTFIASFFFWAVLL